MLYGDAILRSFSVGFLPDWDAVSDKDDDKWEGQTGGTYLQAELLELSCCNAGSNRQALSDTGSEAAQLQALAGSFKALGVKPPRELIAAAHELLFISIEDVLAGTADGTEHVATFADADDFVKVRRIVGTGKTPDRVIGYRESGASALQSFRYSVERFSPEQAKAHSSEHGATFTAAKATDRELEPEPVAIVEPAHGDVEKSQTLRRAHLAVDRAIASLS
jgi:hypothetical protein